MSLQRSSGLMNNEAAPPLPSYLSAVAERWEGGTIFQNIALNKNSSANDVFTQIKVFTIQVLDLKGY